MRALAFLAEGEAQALDGVLFDLDDTVWSHGVLTREAFAALWDMKEAGLRLVAVTGRPSAWGEVIARQWPIDGAVTENGAVDVVREGKGVAIVFDGDDAAVAARRAKLDALVLEVKRRLPHVRLADDSDGRRSDVAWDVGERATVPEADVAALARIVVEAGARTTRSSVHLHATYERDDKASGVVRFLHTRWGVDAGAALQRYAFVGDSANDAACFSAFRATFGVANVRAFLDRMRSRRATSRRRSEARASRRSRARSSARGDERGHSAASGHVGRAEAAPSAYFPVDFACTPTSNAPSWMTAIACVRFYGFVGTNGARADSGAPGGDSLFARTEVPATTVGARRGAHARSWWRSLAHPRTRKYPSSFWGRSGAYLALARRMYRRRSPLASLVSLCVSLSLALALAGCGSTPTTTSSSPTDAAAEQSLAEGGVAASEAGAATCKAAACAVSRCAALAPSCVPDLCPQAEICATASFLEQDGSTSSGGGSQRYTTNGPDTMANARCALQALRDGAVGRVSWTFGGGTHGYRETTDIAVGRVAWGTFSESVDSPTEQGGYAKRPLKPASFFGDCLATDDVDAFARCLEDPFEGC